MMRRHPQHAGPYPAQPAREPTMSDTSACPCCKAPYGHGPDDCPLCRSARRKDVIVRIVIGLMFVVPMLTLIFILTFDSGFVKY